MLVKIFDIQDGIAKPSEHCYTLKSLKDIMEAYPDPLEYMPRYLYVFYMTCPDPLSNPFFNLPNEEKQSTVLFEVKAEFSIDDPLIDQAISFCNKCYDTPTKRAYEGFKAMMDRLAAFMGTQSLSTGRDGSLDPIVRAAEKYQKLRESFKGVEKDYNDEIKNRVRGDRFKSYDQ